MGKCKRDRQPTMWVATTELPTSASHPFYARRNQLLRDHGFDDWSSQDSVETSSAQHMSRFKLFGAHTAKMTVPTRSIVERVDVVGDLSDRQRTVLVDLGSQATQLVYRGLRGVTAYAYAKGTRCRKGRPTLARAPHDAQSSASAGRLCPDTCVRPPPRAVLRMSGRHRETAPARR